jgi:hypothetical protein
MNFNYNNRQYSVTLKSSLEIQLSKAIAFRNEIRNRKEDPLVTALLRLDAQIELRNFNATSVNVNTVDDYKDRLNNLFNM